MYTLLRQLLNRLGKNRTNQINTMYIIFIQKENNLRETDIIQQISFDSIPLVIS